MRVEQMINSRGNGAMNQFVITDGARVVFQSYDSTIAEVDRENHTITIYPDYDYSRTTGKHRNIFFGDYVGMWELATLAGLRQAMKNGLYIGRGGEGWQVITK